MFTVPFISWFSQRIIIGGDFRFFWPENIGDFVTFPTAWDASLNTGLGSSSLSLMWINTYLNFTAVFSQLGLSWNLIGLLFWILPAISLSFFSALYCFKSFFPDKRKYGILAGIIYLFNTYFLMIFTGGQLGVSLAYSIAPFVFLTFKKSIDSPTFRKSLLSSLVLGLQMLFDPRLVYITSIAIFIYWLFNIRSIKHIIKQLAFVFILPYSIGLSLHSYWIVPLILTRDSSISAGFTSLLGLKFLSFSDFSHSLSLLHPNWPENLFGKTYFMRSEFILLPILAFSSLFFLHLVQKRIIIFFAFLGLLGAFLAKGANPPFGEVYIWLFSNFPGFVAFRDPTKFYLLISLSYSILIPFTILSLSDWSSLRFKMKGYRQNVLLIVSIFYVLVLASPLLVRQFNLISTSHEISNDYLELKNFLSGQSQFFRTLWIPTWQRFGYFSNLHPAIKAPELFQDKDSFSIIKELNTPDVQNKFKNFSVKYIVVPYDSEGEIFLEDRKYQDTQYKKIINDLKQLKFLHEITGFGNIKVFELPQFNDHFFLKNKEASVNSYKEFDPTKYVLNVSNVRKGDILIFSEKFDRNWQAKTENNLINSKPYAKLLNSFTLEDNGDYTIEVNYRPQKLVNIGVFVSIIVTICLMGLLVKLRKNRSI